ncbi:MAG: AbrB/MazE/SpoVT family DNA-binding domain-containing protein [Thermomicrobiales bacterium]
MKTIDATITSQGQVTIPAEIRRRLGLNRRDKVTFVLDEDDVRLVRARYTVESAFGAVAPIPGTSADFDEEIEEAMQDEADRVVGRLRV